MPIKLFAVDMDGTFLTDDKRYDKVRFLEQYALLKQRGIRFVVASGNQYYQLLHYFPEIHQEIAFVAENGAYVVDAGQEIHCGQFSEQQVARILAVITGIPDINLVVCAKNSAYALTAMPQAVIDKMSNHYRRLQRVEDFNAIDDTIFKFSLNMENHRIADLVQKLDEQLGDIVKPVSSGFGFMDLIVPGLHKANGIRLLQSRWGISDNQVVALGDSDNDIEMLQHAGFGFAMANASPQVVAAAGYRTTSNNEQGVLNVIDQLLAGKPPFDAA